MTDSQYKALLLKVRCALVKKFSVYAYAIFKEESIDDILRVKPKTIEELSTIKGFPKNGARCTKYGAYIIEVFKPRRVKDVEKAVAKSTGLSLDEMKVF